MNKKSSLIFNTKYLLPDIGYLVDRFIISLYSYLMALITHDYIKSQIARDNSFSMENFDTNRMIKSLNESTKTEYYDIFLSHSYLDADEILYLQNRLTRMNCSVFVDWIEYPDLNRQQVTKNNVEMIRNVMKKCNALIYAFSDNVRKSSWMPWELGFFDGYSGNNENICILPITNDNIDDDEYQGVEYLGIYPFISLSKCKDGKLYYYVNYSNERYEKLNRWIQKIKDGSL